MPRAPILLVLLLAAAPFQGCLGPAMQRVLQAIGRGVRGHDHRAFIGLLDRRFTQRGIQKWMPPEMNPRPVQDVAESANRFFA